MHIRNEVECAIDEIDNIAQQIEEADLVVKQLKHKKNMVEAVMHRKLIQAFDKYYGIHTVSFVSKKGFIFTLNNDKIISSTLINGCSYDDILNGSFIIDRVDEININVRPKTIGETTLDNV